MTCCDFGETSERRDAVFDHSEVYVTKTLFSRNKYLTLHLCKIGSNLTGGAPSMGWFPTVCGSVHYTCSSCLSENWRVTYCSRAKRNEPRLKVLVSYNCAKARCTGCAAWLRKNRSAKNQRVYLFIIHAQEFSRAGLFVHARESRSGYQSDNFSPGSFYFTLSRYYFYSVLIMIFISIFWCGLLMYSLI